MAYVNHEFANKYAMIATSGNFDHEIELEEDNSIWPGSSKQIPILSKYLSLGRAVGVTEDLEEIYELGIPKNNEDSDNDDKQLNKDVNYSPSAETGVKFVEDEGDYIEEENNDEHVSYNAGNTIELDEDYDNELEDKNINENLMPTPLVAIDGEPNEVAEEPGMEVDNSSINQQIRLPTQEGSRSSDEMELGSQGLELPEF